MPTVGGEDVAEDSPELAVGGETLHHLLDAVRCQPAEGAEPRQQPRATQQQGQRPRHHLQDAQQRHIPLRALRGGRDTGDHPRP